MDDQQQILLIHRNTAKLTQWELPGGKLEDEETAGQAAIRELKEELGIDISEIEEIGSAEFQDENDDKNYHYIWFKAGKVAGEPEIQEEAHDAIKYFPTDKIKGPEFSTNSKWLAKAIAKRKVSI